jgi:hypothetical protein
MLLESYNGIRAYLMGTYFMLKFRSGNGTDGNLNHFSYSVCSKYVLHSDNN